MKKNFFIFLCSLPVCFFGQTITPQVINSAGQSYPTGVSGVYITDNIGEPFTETIGSNFIISQGFLQPLTTAIATLSIIHNDVSCKDKKDGNISIALSNLLPNAQIQYIWTPSVVCPNSNCSRIDSLIAGTYSVKIMITYSIQGGGFKTDSLIPAPIIINDVNGPCRIKIYTAVSPNDDGSNDSWQIDNISEFPANHVSIYNRWGQQVFETHGYDNVSKFWPTKEDLNKLVSSTYFYVINLGDGTSSLKGWVELIKN